MWLILPALILVLAILSAFIISTDFSTLSNALSLSRSPLPHSLIEYQRYLIDYYSDHYPLYSKLVFSTNRPERPINLVLVRKEKNENDTSLIRHQELLSNGSVTEIQKRKASVKTNEIGSLNGEKTAAHFVLIEGGPGMGKSTLCWQLCRLWREVKLQWDLMVIVEIRDESTRRASNLYDLLYHPDEETRRDIAQDIEKREGEGLLIFLDGYDELSKEQQRELSVLQKILRNRLLRKATVVVTSRPHATANLPPQFKQGLDQHIEISGFNESDIHTYITLACKDNQHLLETFRSYVDSHPFILSVMYNPLHCTIVTELYIQYWQNGRKVFAPNTLTQLYDALVLNLLRRDLYLSQSPIAIEKLSDLPQDVYTCFMQLAKLASIGLQEKRYIFNSIPCDTLGLMTSVKRIYDIRAERPTSYMFLHLTLQEYLSALYYSQQPEVTGFLYMLCDIADSIEQGMYSYSILHEPMAHWPFLLFIVGLESFQRLAIQTLRTVKMSHPRTTRVSLTECQALFEAQSPELVSEYFANKTLEVHQLSSQLNNFVVAYCIVHTTKFNTWEIHITDWEQLHFLLNNLNYFLKGTDWNKKPKPSMKLFFILSYSENIHRKVLSKLRPITKT